MLDVHQSSPQRHCGMHDTGDDIDASDSALAVQTLACEAFTKRFVRTDCNAAEPDAGSPLGRALKERVREEMDVFRTDLNGLEAYDIHGGILQRIRSDTTLTIADMHRAPRFIPTARDLLHVYGPDINNTGDRDRYFRYAWTQAGPNAVIYSDDPQIIRQGKLGCRSYAYSGQSSYALTGAGLFFSPEFGDANIVIRPYVQWLTSASFTGNDPVNAYASAYLGIFVQSWAKSGGSHHVDRDHSINVWTQNTQDYKVNATAGGAASGGDGLEIKVFAVASRRYSIYVYAYVETVADPQQTRNEVRFVGLDIEASVPYVVVEETLA